jgi:hypothetical protein
MKILWNDTDRIKPKSSERNKRSNQNLYDEKPEAWHSRG